MALQSLVKKEAGARRRGLTLSHLG